MHTTLRRIIFGKRRAPSGGGGAPPPWTPLDLGADLRAWWNADDLANGAVSSWTDRKNSYALAQATSGNRPNRSATAWPTGTRPGVTYATDDFLETAHLSGLPQIPVGGNASQMFVAASFANVAGSNTVLAWGNSTNGRRLRVTGLETLELFINEQATTVIHGTAGGALGDHILQGRLVGTTIGVRIDGGTETTATMPGAATTDDARLRSGASEVTTAAAFLNAVKRHIIITADLSQADREKLEGWIAHDCGIASQLPVAHPYRSAAP